MQDYYASPPSQRFLGITSKLLNGTGLSRAELVHLLGIQNPLELNHLYRLARQRRDQYFNRQVFLYGFIYFSTHCRNNCSFCSFRNNNRSLSRYRKNENEILSAAHALKAEKVHLIDLTMGEDPLLHSGIPGTPETPGKPEGYDKLSTYISTIIEETGLPVMLSPGVLGRETLRQFADQGLSWFACYQETHSRDHFNNLRKNQDFQKRIDSKLAARSSGLLIEEGILLGAGETKENIADSLLWMYENQIDQVRAMTYVQNPSTCIGCPARPSVPEETVIAVMRLLMPDSLIPASLDIEGLSGLKTRLDSGANVVTSIVPENSGLTGVANGDDNGDDKGDSNDSSKRRGYADILPLLHECGLQVASHQDYDHWLQRRKQQWRSKASSLEKCV